jgi:hypothetical protein
MRPAPVADNRKIALLRLNRISEHVVDVNEQGELLPEKDGRGFPIRRLAPSTFSLRPLVKS